MGAAGARRRRRGGARSGRRGLAFDCLVAGAAGPVEAGEAGAVELTVGVGAGQHVVVVDLRLAGVGLVVGDAVPLGKSFWMAGSAPTGRVATRSVLVLANRRPRRSYQGPGPTRSMACTGLPVPSLVALRKARQVFCPAPGLAALGDGGADLVGAAQAGVGAGLAIAQVAAEAVGVARQACSALRLVTKKLNLDVGSTTPPSLPALPPSARPWGRGRSHCSDRRRFLRGPSMQSFGIPKRDMGRLL